MRNTCARWRKECVRACYRHNLSLAMSATDAFPTEEEMLEDLEKELSKGDGEKANCSRNKEGCHMLGCDEAPSSYTPPMHEHP